MYSLTLHKTTAGKAVGYVKKGVCDGDKLYLTEKNDAETIKELRSFREEEKRSILERLKEALDEDVPREKVSSRESVQCLYEKMKFSKTGVLTDGAFAVCPPDNPEEREIIYCAGASGCGKSHFARGYAEKYASFYPDRKIYLISKLKEDETLDGAKCKIHRIRADTLVSHPVQDIKHEFSHSLVIFDDYDTFTGELYKKVLNLIDTIASTGRHSCISMICCSHYITNNQKTRLLLSEAQRYIIFPTGTSAISLHRLLNAYLGLSPKDIQKVKSLGRWVCLSRMFPPYAIYEKGAYLLHS